MNVYALGIHEYVIPFYFSSELHVVSDPVNVMSEQSSNSLLVAILNNRKITKFKPSDQVYFS